MSAHAYWRLWFIGSNGGAYIQLTEVAFLDGAGVDLSIGGVASASSYYDAPYVPAMAFDKSSATDWSTRSSDFPCHLQYQHPTPVDVRGVRIRCSSNASWLPRSLSDVGVSSSSDGTSWLPPAFSVLRLVSGSFTPGAEVLLAVEQAGSPPASGVDLAGATLGRPWLPFTGAGPVVGLLSGRRRDWRLAGDSLGMVRDRVMVKHTPTSPETPFAGGRVWLLRAVDGYKAWEGWSDAEGWYTAVGLEVGVEYIAVGIDPYRDHKAAGAGPVVAIPEAAP